MLLLTDFSKSREEEECCYYHRVLYIRPVEARHHQLTFFMLQAGPLVFLLVDPSLVISVCSAPVGGAY